ncbi:MAG: S1 RNA-binding domain-containing protein [Chloroflexi bacterium]|nr:S1 RNA-binding domain-containing protein [Chloroflexota bacterium]
MNIPSSFNPQRTPSVDDSYWTSLFEQEEANTLPTAENGSDLCSDTAPSLPDNTALQQNLPGNGHDPWQRILSTFKSDKQIELHVTGYNKGGLLVNWLGIQGFIPASQLIDFPQVHLEIERINALKKWCNKRLTLKIIEVNQEQNRLILSERVALVEAGEREQLLKKIEPDDLVAGEITNLTNFGAFVDLGGVEGLIHISELSWSRVSHPSDILSPGEQVQVKVLKVDANNGRVALSLKQLKCDPWQTVDQHFQSGQIIEGTVSKIVSFGVFVQIEDELEGLIHISELAEGAFFHPRNVVRKGQHVSVRVLQVDGAAKRLALSLRAVSS